MKVILYISASITINRGRHHSAIEDSSAHCYFKVFAEMQGYTLHTKKMSGFSTVFQDIDPAKQWTLKSRSPTHSGRTRCPDFQCYQEFKTVIYGFQVRERYTLATWCYFIFHFIGGL